MSGAAGPWPLISLADVTVRFSPAVMGRRLIPDLLRGHRREPFTALSRLSVELDIGSSVGVIGSNGAGKSTLLKVIAGIVPPSEGRASIRGEVTPILELGAGLESALDGWENIRLAAALQRMSPRTARDFTEYVVEFSELADALSRPVRTYSTGMVLRLVFSLRTFVRPQILVLDEVFGVGDQSFTAKARARTSELLRSTSLLVFASHDLRLIREFCQHTMWLSQGRLHRLGPTEPVVAAYEAEM